ncbi:SDR family NAD(P)-dependent oxidoreductase [Streptomyces beihaiensis]|uniref:SDR family NAD(P)-dependent oxidoreductase n=1 Tax=Streptomyces beihaiensis TaxID=2984495 RepID=A0ABT3TQF9_9ACTN|nr:SDR family NAD(P)-dependent oxidoreductase [Streptomyces beihaiensis]MCX3059246.1 SDR family NAD(P)-dependent oxidoreductase [Streptomyces beihaiensis]
MSVRFDGQVALVTGGGEGIGRAAAVAYARAGARVMVVGRHGDQLRTTVELARHNGAVAEALVADLTEAGGAEYAVTATIARFEALDVAFNNITERSARQPVADIHEDVWGRTLAANLTGVWRAMKHEIAHMERAGGGVIVNTASNIGVQGMLPGLGAYAASSAAVSALTRTAAREYAAKGIRINAVSPCPLGRGTGAEEIADTVVWLSSGAAAYIVGHDLVLDRKTSE